MTGSEDDSDGLLGRITVRARRSSSRRRWSGPWTHARGERAEGNADRRPRPGNGYGRCQSAEPSPGRGVEEHRPRTSRRPGCRPPSASGRSRRNRAPCRRDRKSTRLNSSHVRISYAVFCLKKKKKIPKVQSFAYTKKKNYEKT